MARSLFYAVTVIVVFLIGWGTGIVFFWGLNKKQYAEFEFFQTFSGYIAAFCFSCFGIFSNSSAFRAIYIDFMRYSSINNNASRQNGSGFYFSEMYFRGVLYSSVPD
ncbi:hypothetical protein ECTX1999_2253 [Escherichia coli TX1999]|nr:hypothetical protein ECTX1999_2253 [Escherichia coli TX1999]